MENNLVVTNLHKYYKQRIKSENSSFISVTKKVKALDGVSFSVSKGEIVGIIGESGCGKSTLGKLLINLETPSMGEIFINNKDSKSIIKNNMLSFRRLVQMIFQNPYDSFDPRNTIIKSIISTLKLHSIGNTEKEMYDIACSSMKEVGLEPAEDYLHRYPHELSGGQLQRISILRAMLLKPKILIADEPVSMLDVSVRADIIKMLKNLSQSNNTSLIFISHDINTVRYISDRVMVMYLGRIVESGYTDEVLHNPHHPYTKVLISNCSSIDVFEKKEKIKISGDPPTPIDNGPGCYFAPRCYMAKNICFEKYPDISNINDNHSATCHFYKEI